MLTDTAVNENNAPAKPADTSESSVTKSPTLETCVICLESVHEKATALPCCHDQFHFVCLGTWIQQQRVCPLCKAEIRSIKYASDGHAGSVSFFHFPVPKQENILNSFSRAYPTRVERYRSHARRQQRHSTGDGVRRQFKNDAVEFRRYVYRNGLYSSHVGVNRISRYQNITPKAFHDNPHLISRAKMFIRRELSVFDFLTPGRASEEETSDTSSSDRRASNAEFLLEYIISILKSIDIRGSTGQAEDLLSEFLGRDHTRLFLHELEAWLRSPYETLAHWDRHVQYSGLRQRGRAIK